MTPVEKNPAGVEEHYMTVETISLNSFEDLVADGTLVDETTVLGLYLARAHLDRHATTRRERCPAPSG